MSKDQNSISTSNLFKFNPVAVLNFSFLSIYQNCSHFHLKRVLLWHIQTSWAARCHDSTFEDFGIWLCSGETHTVSSFCIIHRIHRSLKCHHVSYIVDNGSGVTVYVWARQGGLSEKLYFPRVPPARWVPHRATWTVGWMLKLFQQSKTITNLMYAVKVFE